MRHPTDPGVTFVELFGGRDVEKEVSERGLLQGATQTVSVPI